MKGDFVWFSLVWGGLH